VRAAVRPIEEGDLQAWVDGRLTPAENEAVEDYFAAHPESRARWSQYAEQREELRAAFRGTAENPIPPRLRVARLLAEQRRRRRRQLGRIAAAVALLIAGGIGGWGAHDLLPGLTSSASAVLASAVFDDAFAAHRTFSVETRHPVEVGANEEAHLVQWLSKRLGHQLIVPDLSALGFQLMGGRLLPADSGPAALFMYENGKGTRLSCYYLVVDVAGETEFQFREQNGTSAFYWVDDGLAYAIVANTDRGLLLKVAEIIYQQNSPDGAKAKLPPAPGKPS
jgi:anti-sigma factor RsiW